MKNVRLSVAVVCVGLICGIATLSAHQATTEAARDRWNKEFAGPLPNLNRNANALLVSAVKGREPGRALDLGVGEGRNAMFDAMDVVAAHARIHPAVALLRRVRGTPGQEYDLAKAEAVLDDVDAFLATIETAEVP